MKINRILCVFTNKIRFALTIVIPIFVLISCESKKAPLDVALEAAGDNKQELIKVLDHYSKSSFDTLKLKAADSLYTI